MISEGWSHPPTGVKDQSSVKHPPTGIKHQNSLLVTSKYSFHLFGVICSMWDAEFSRSELDFEQDRTRWTSTNWTPPPSLVIRVVHHDLLLMVQKSGIHQLRLVVFAIVHQVFYITGACLGFLNHQQYPHSLWFISQVWRPPTPSMDPSNFVGQLAGVTTCSPDVRAPFAKDFYFSDANLRRDRYMKQRVDEGGVHS